MTRSQVSTVQENSFASWREFKDAIDSFQPQWIFRGQARASWELSSSLGRSRALLEIDRRIERILIAQYQRMAPSLIPPSEVPRATLEWLAYLQHHGTPTRLIDFTASPYIAAYFAFVEDQEDESEPVAVWCIDKIRFFQAAVYYLDDKFEVRESDAVKHTFSDETFEQLFPHSLNCVIPLSLSKLVPRQLSQQALFLAEMNPGESFAAQLAPLGYQDGSLITKILIPRSERKSVLRDLARMNITHATLFPGIDGFAKSLNMKYTTLPTVGELGGRLQELKRLGVVV